MAATKTARKTRAGSAARKTAPGKAGPGPAAAGAKAAKASAKGAEGPLLVRMYRVGFGDFFLVTVPTADGPRFILIDCGVHLGDLGTMSDCVRDMAEYTDRKLALVIVTHRHADHISGFGSEEEQFKEFEVESVWITNRLAPDNPQAVKTMQQVTALAQHLQLALGAREDNAGKRAKAMAGNALGIAKASNADAMRVVTSGFKNKPDIHYYEAGDEPALPKSLQGALTARILGPVGKDAAAEFKAADNKAAQYLAAVEDNGLPGGTFQPFDRRWPASAQDYPEAAFRSWRSSVFMEQKLIAMQPDMLAAAAATIDGTLNNQSLVVLFSCRGKQLLFVGDAQWGNWASWLYGRPVKGKDPGITPEARDLLSTIDFYKVGHHGSKNATPIPAVGAMRWQCAGMCSTQDDCYSDVPRLPLLDALDERTGKQMVRSDWIAVDGAEGKASEDARNRLSELPENFEEGELYIEYRLPD